MSAASHRISLEDRILCVTLYHKYENAGEVQRQFQLEKGKKAPTRKAILKLSDRFKNTGSVADLPRTGRKRSVTTPDIVAKVSDALSKNPNQSARKMAKELSLSTRTLMRVMKEIGMKPQQMNFLHELTDDDQYKRMNFCREWLNKIQLDETLQDKVIWSAEFFFQLNGHVSRPNCEYWTYDAQKKENFNKKTQGLTVWAGIWSGGIIGPYIFDINLSGSSYLNLLRNQVTQAIIATGIPYMWFMQDGVPTYFTLEVWEWLNANFPGRWIGRQGPIEWPSRSSDLTPHDFFLWGILKENVFSSKPKSILDLQNAIYKAFESFTPDLCTKVCRSVTTRLKECLENKGKQVI